MTRRIHCVRVTRVCAHATVCKGGSHAAQRLQNAGKHLDLDLLPKHERPQKPSTGYNTLSVVCVPANWSPYLKWYLDVARSNSRTLYLAS